MDKTELNSALQHAGLAGIAQEIQQISQESIRLTAQSANLNDLAPAASRLGGMPGLPPDSQWPEFDGQPMSFIAQIQMTEVAPFDEEGRLPRTGCLYFFYDSKQQTYGEDPTDRAGWKVFYADAQAGQLVLAQPPAGLPQNAIFIGCQLNFSRQVTLPQQPAMYLDGFNWTPDERRRYEDFLADFPSGEDRSAIHHRMFGHSDTLQDDMHLQCALMANGARSLDDPNADELAKGAMDWMLLLQIDSDENAGMRWSNNGMLYFWIEKQTLAARNFDKVWLVLQSE
jgi:uncharacterized protein YwqG